MPKTTKTKTKSTTKGKGKGKGGPIKIGRPPIKVPEERFRKKAPK